MTTAQSGLMPLQLRGGDLGRTVIITGALLAASGTTLLALGSGSLVGGHRLGDGHRPARRVRVLSGFLIIATMLVVAALVGTLVPAGTGRALAAPSQGKIASAAPTRSWG